MTTGYRYDGSARYYGVPARDISADEFDRMDPQLQRIVLTSPAYTPIRVDRPLSDMRRAELDAIARERGIDPTAYGNRESLIAALSADDDGDGQEEA